MVNEDLTFSKRTKIELVSKEYTFDEKKGILSAFIHLCGSLSIYPKYSLRIRTSLASTSKFIFNLLKDIYQINPKLEYTKQLRLDKNTVYHINVDEKVEMILKDLEVSEDLNPINLSKMIDNNHLKGFVVGSFLASGQISNPRGKYYYCELSYLDEKTAKQVLSKLLHFKNYETMDFKMIFRRNRFVIYLKRSDQISVFLAYIGAQNMMFEFENSRLEKDYFNTENRLTICAQANYSRALKKGQENLNDIELATKYFPKSYFTKKMNDVIKVRKENKDASYSEIADILCNQSNYISKSGVARIFKKIHDDVIKFQNK